MLNKKCFKMYKSKKTWIFTSTALAVMGVVASLNPTINVSAQEVTTVSSALVQKNLGVGSPKLNEHAVKNNNDNLLEINDHPLSKAIDKSGVFGTAPWDFTAADGVLTIHAGTLPLGGQLGPETVGADGYGYNKSIKKIIIEPGVIPATAMRGLFKDLQVLESIEGLENLKTSNVTDMRSMFSGDRLLTTLDVSGLDTSKVTDMRSMFYDNESLMTLDVSGFDTSNVTNMNSMFHGSNSLTTLDVSGFDTSKVTDMRSMFSHYKGLLKTLDVSSFDTSNVTDMSSMFHGNNSLTLLDVSGFNTSKVTDMNDMFWDTNSLTALDVSSFNTSNVTNMSGMFTNNFVVAALDVSGFDTSKVTDMSGMFSNTYKLTTLDVSDFDTSKVTNMDDMFNQCHSLTTLDVSKWDVSNVTDMGLMFQMTQLLTTLDVSRWNTSSVTDVSYMFNISGITELDLSQWSLASVDTSGNDEYTGTQHMLAGTESLWKVELGTDFINPHDLWVQESPSGNVKINDVNDSSRNYHTSGSNMWREVGSGTDHNPAGKLITAAEISKERTTPREAQTYVWDQNQDMRVKTVNAVDSTVLNTVILQENDGQKITLDPKEYKIPAGYHLATQAELDVLGTNLVQDGLTHEFTVKSPDVNLYVVQDAKLTYKFQDETGKEIKPEETEASFVGGKYDYKAPTITGYTYEKADASLSGTVDKADKVITLTYKQDAKLTYKFQDRTGKEIKPEETEASFVGDKYDYKAPTIAGYTYEKADASLSGTVDKADKVITLTYKQDAKLTYKFQDSYGKEIKPEETEASFVGDKYDYKAPKITGYTYEKADASLSGTVDKADKVITLTYKINDGVLPTPEKAKVTFKFVDEYGKTIASDNVLDGFVGNAFNFTAPKISGYKYKSADAELKGDLTAGNKVITLTYTTDDSELPTPEKAKVTFKFVDEYGKAIASDNVLDGFVGNAYNFTAPKISGYKYKSADAALKGDLVAGNKVITLTYTTDDSELPTPEKAKVTFKFVDENGKSIASDNVLDGFVGNAFNFTAPKISGYKYKSADSALKGDITVGNKVITLTYTTDDSVLPTPEKAKVTFKFVDENGKAIASDNVLDGFVGNAFNFTAPKISGYKYKSADAALKGDLTAGNKVITLTYTTDDSVPPTPEKAKVTFKFVDENGKVIASDNVLDGFVGGTFNFTAPKINGYKYKSADAALKGDLIAGNKVITLTYTAEDSNVQNPIVNAHGSELSVGDSWNAEDNFDGAFDEDGQKVDFKDVTVSGTVDTTKAGSYKITYSYQGVSKTIVVTVVAKPEKEKPTEEKPVEEKPEKEETVPPLNEPDVPDNKTGTGQVAKKADTVKNEPLQPNQSGETLPQTGEKVNHQSVWAGLGLILLSTWLIFVSKRRRSK